MQEQSRMTLPRRSRITGGPRISEPELDMCRHYHATTGSFSRVYLLIRRLIAHHRDIVAPMRSIGRELEESWPTRDW